MQTHVHCSLLVLAHSYFMNGAPSLPTYVTYVYAYAASVNRLLPCFWFLLVTGRIYVSELCWQCSGCTSGRAGKIMRKKWFMICTLIMKLALPHKRRQANLHTGKLYKTSTYHSKYSHNNVEVWVEVLPGNVKDNVPSVTMATITSIHSNWPQQE